MTTSLTIRPVRPEDYPSWCPLWDGYNAFYGRSGPTALPEAVTAQTWARFFDAYEPVHALVAERDGHLVGLAHYLFHRTTTRIEPNCYLNDLFTDPDVRGAGVGRALIDGVFAAADAAGVTGIYWLTHETNATAMRLYDQVATRSGFIRYTKVQ
jgi:GNAT superfamily N-acetyltransferase